MPSCVTDLSPEQHPILLAFGVVFGLGVVAAYWPVFVTADASARTPRSPPGDNWRGTFGQYQPGGGGATSSPGNAATSPGSVFNEPGTNSLNGGKGNQAYNTNARTGPGGIAHNGTGQPEHLRNMTSACGKVTANGAGTPMQEPPTPPNVLPTDITNNARDTRAISHTGKGANK